MDIGGMNKCRLSGNVVEKALCDVFGRMGLECSSPARLQRLNMRVGRHIPNEKLLTPITQKVKCIVPYNATKFSISSDHDGKKGIVSDVIVHNDTSAIGISCKRNNFSIKHQRPQALHKHLALSESETQDYKAKYALITSIFFKLCMKYGWTLFREVPKECKQELYRDVNVLVKNTIMAATPEQHTTLLNYLISKHDNGYVLYVGQDEADVHLYKYNWGDMRRIKSVNCKGTTKIVLDVDDAKISMRLHNASSCITKTVSLKYDTTIVNMEGIRHELL